MGCLFRILFIIVAICAYPYFRGFWHSITSLPNWTALVLFIIIVIVIFRKIKI